MRARRVTTTVIAVALLVAGVSARATAAQPAPRHRAVPANFVWHGVAGNYIPLSGDFDGDHHDDVFWYAPGRAADWVWFGRADRHFDVVREQVLGSYRPVVLDFNGDGRSDVLWYGPGGGHDSVWFGNANHTFSEHTLAIGGNYEPIAGDFNGDGHDDVIWYGFGAENDTEWVGAGHGHFATRRATINGEYTTAVGDYNGDGRSDILYDSLDPPHPTYLDFGMANGSFSTNNISGITPRSRVFAVDVNHDGADEAFVYNPGAAADSILYFRRGSIQVSKRRLTEIDGPNYRPFVGDFDGDGHDDIFWYGPGSLPDHVWFDVANEIPAA